MSPTPSIISTEHLAPGERLPMWDALLRERFGSLLVPLRGDTQFDGRLAFSEIDDLHLCRIDATRHRVIRTPGAIRQDGRGGLKAVVQLRGTASFEQAGRRVVLRAGEWCVYDTSRSYVVTNPESVSHLVVLLPHERLRALGATLDAVTARRLPGHGGARGFAYQQLVAAFEAAPGHGARAVADRLAELVGMAILEHAGVQTDGSLRARTCDRVRAYIDANLRDPAMTLDRLARALGCSKRNLHKLFRDEGETLGAYIWQARLARIRDELAAPRSARARSPTSPSTGASAVRRTSAEASASATASRRAAIARWRPDPESSSSAGGPSAPSPRRRTRRSRR